MPKQEKFKFRKLDRVGAVAAEEDAEFLHECFINTGDLEVLKDCSKPQRMVLGRTGSGKSALLLQLCQVEERCIQVRPESLALSYVSNSTILKFLAELGVNLDVFFRLLWRHVFTVEILKHHFKIFNEEAKQSFIDHIFNLFKDKKHTKAVDYLRKWGETFWEETEYRIKELTTKLEDDVRAQVESKIPRFSATVGCGSKLSEEEKTEVVQRAQYVVNAVQIRQLSEIIDLLDDVLRDDQKRYFIVLDRLDENWIEEKLRLRLIRALIETAKDFNRVRHAKIVLAMRLDLIDRVFRLTRDAGFQEEKYESLYLPVVWKKEQLVELLNSRINSLIRQRYTKQRVTHKDILPKDVDGLSAIDYMLARTMMRPRDLILFFNFCIEKAVDRAQVTVQMLREAEAEYSRHRLRSLGDEWISDYPNLLEFCAILKARHKQFSASNISTEECETFCLEFLSGHPNGDVDELYTSANAVVNQTLTTSEFRVTLLRVFFRVGLVGLKLETYETVSWAYQGNRISPAVSVNELTRVSIHPAFYRVLGTKTF